MPAGGMIVAGWRRNSFIPVRHGPSGITDTDARTLVDEIRRLHSLRIGRPTVNECNRDVSLTRASGTDGLPECTIELAGPKAHYYFFGGGWTAGSLLGGTMFFSRM
jgi:hypothetical protein